MACLPTPVRGIARPVTLVAIALMTLMTACGWGASGCSSRPKGSGGNPGEGGAASPAVVLFLVDGLTAAALDTAVSAGANHFAFLLANGVRVATAHSTSPAAVIQLPDGSPGGTQPWGHATSGNVAVHTGCHLFESRQMDDIFLAARDAGIRSVYSGGDANYAVFTTADFHYGAMMDDATTVGHAITHLQRDGARLLRIHLQRARDSWTGPQSATDPSSPYVAHLLEVDGLLGRLMDALQTVGVWDDTYLVLAADHGMGQATSSTHPASTPSSWDPVMAFYGPGLKRGATIPYAELPDVAVTAAHFLGLRPLRGHLDPAVSLALNGTTGTTGTVLTNLFEGQPDSLEHPRYVERCLAMGAACTSSGDDFGPYRQTMLSLIR